MRSPISMSDMLRCAIAWLGLWLSAPVWAAEFDERYPALPIGVEYRFDYWEKTTAESPPAPPQAIELVMNYYALPEDLRDKLFTRVVLAVDQTLLLQVGVWGANDAAGFPREFAAHRSIAEKNCNEVNRRFAAYCATLDDIARLQPQVIVDLAGAKVIPIPVAVRADAVRRPAIAVENFDPVIRNNIAAFDDLYIGAGSNGPGLYQRMRFAFDGGSASHRCFAGNYGIADVDGDGHDDLLFVGGRTEDSLFDWQLDEKIYAYARIYVVAIDFSQGIARPLFQDELFAYEMDYRGPVDGRGEGIVREARFYWGDFDVDGDADYLVRRQSAAISLDWGLAEPLWQPGPASESVFLYEGDGAGYRPAVDGGEELLQYVRERTDWNRGFPNPHDCR